MTEGGLEGLEDLEGHLLRPVGTLDRLLGPLHP